jgi:hypothetical protein
MLKMFRRKQKYVANEYNWVVVYEVGGIPMKYFRWDMEQTWKWTKTPSRATQFRTESQAERDVESCSMAWRSQYQIRKVPA